MKLQVGLSGTDKPTFTSTTATITGLSWIFKIYGVGAAVATNKSIFTSAVFENSNNVGLIQMGIFTAVELVNCTISNNNHTYNPLIKSTSSEAPTSKLTTASEAN